MNLYTIITAINMILAMKGSKKIPIHVVEEHNEAMDHIYNAIGAKKLPLEGTALVHLDAHPDLNIGRELTGTQARSGKDLLPLLEIENWIMPAVAAGHIGRVAWLHPPWAKQFADGTRTFRIGDQPATGLLRVDSKEPYYLSDALYSSQLTNTKNCTLIVAELSDSVKSAESIAETINITEPYILDIDLDFFSTDHPFRTMYQNIGFYDLLEPIFEFKLPKDDSQAEIDKVVKERDQQLNELESIFLHLIDHDTLENYAGEKTKLFYKVSGLVQAVKKEAQRLGQKPDWWIVYSAGCTRDQGGLPHHISSEEEIRRLVKNGLEALLRRLPPPLLITIARSSDDDYCPSHQVDMIQSLVLDTLKAVYNNTDDPALHYLRVYTY